MLLLPPDPGRRVQIRDLIEAKGVRPVFVHLGTPERAKPYFDYYHLSDVQRISDPEASLYGSSVFELPRKNVFSQFFIPSVWKAWLLVRCKSTALAWLRKMQARCPAFSICASGPSYVPIAIAPSLTSRTI